MHDERTRVIQVRFTSDPQGDCLRKAGPTRYGVVILYPLEVKRMLATVDTAKGRAVKLAREIIQRRCHRPPALDTLACTVEVTRFDLRPFTDVAWTLEDGTKVFLTEALAAAAIRLGLALVGEGKRFRQRGESGHFSASRSASRVGGEGLHSFCRRLLAALCPLSGFVITHVVG